MLQTLAMKFALVSTRKGEALDESMPFQVARVIARLCGGYSREPDDHCHGVPATDEVFFVVRVGEGGGKRERERE